MLQGLAQARRVAVVAALCAVAAIGLQARAALPTKASGLAAEASGQAFYDVIGAVTGASAVAGIVFLVILARLRRKRKRNRRPDATPLPWWGRMLAVLLALAVISGPVVLIYRALQHRRRELTAPALPALLHRHPAGTLANNASGNWAFIAGMAFAAVALITAAVLARRQQNAADWPAAWPSPSASLHCGPRCRPDRGLARGDRSAGRDHRLLRGDGAEPGRRGSGARRGGHPGRGAHPGGVRRPDPLGRRGRAAPGCSGRRVTGTVTWRRPNAWPRRAH